MDSNNTFTNSHHPDTALASSHSPTHDEVRDALCKGSDVVAELLLVECSLAVVRDGGDQIRELDADAQHLVITAAVDSLHERIGALREAFEALWSIS